MHDFFDGVRLSAAVVGGIGVVWGALSADTIMTVAGIAAGFAAFCVYAWRAPRDADMRGQMQIFSEQLRRHEDMLADETRAHDATREKLRIAKDALVELGVRIKQLESESGIYDAPRLDP